MTDRLASCREKIKRAKQHIRNLETEVQAFRDTKPYVITAKRDPQTRRPVYYVVGVKDTGPTIPLIAGDALQNLRSALDHMAYQLVWVGTNGTGPFKDTYFPAGFDSATKYKAHRMGQIKGMRPDAIKAIDCIEPYQGGKGNILWRLHTLNKIDKHRLLIVVVSRLDGVGASDVIQKQFEKLWSAKSLPGAPPVVSDVFWNPADKGPMKAGDELYIGAPDEEVNENKKFMIDVALSESQITETEPLIPSVHQMAKFVDGLLPTFELLLIP